MADIEPIDPADMLTLMGYFFDTPHTIERAYRKRGQVYVVTRPVVLGHRFDLETTWRYDGIVDQQLRLTVVG